MTDHLTEAHLAIEAALEAEDTVTISDVQVALVHMLRAENFETGTFKPYITHAVNMLGKGIALRQLKRGLILAGRSIAVYECFPECPRCEGLDDFCADGYCADLGTVGIPHEEGEPPYAVIQSWETEL